MAKKTLLLTSIGFYQMVRFLILMVFLVIMGRVSSESIFSGIALAIGGAAILPTLLLLQLILTRSPVLIAPLRVGLALQLIGSLITLAQVALGHTSLSGFSTTTVGFVGILVLLDAASLLFLLSFTPQSGPQQQTASSKDASEGPRITVEEVEDQK